MTIVCVTTTCVCVCVCACMRVRVCVCVCVDCCVREVSRIYTNDDSVCNEHVCVCVCVCGCVCVCVGGCGCACVSSDVWLGFAVTLACVVSLVSQLEMCAPSWSPWYTRLSDLRGWLFMTSLCPGAAKVVSSQPLRISSHRHAPRVNQRLTMCDAKSLWGCRRCTMNCITSCRTQTVKEPLRGSAGVRGTPRARMRVTNLLYMEQQGCTDVASTFWVAGVRRGTGRLVVSVRRC